ncbi:MAG: serine protease [Phenylobacterium sp.]|jgi:serine protease
MRSTILSRALPLALPLLCLSQFASADLLVSEVLYDAPNSDTTEEFVELYNPSCTAVNLSDYSLSDNAGTFNLSGTLNGGSYATIARNSTGFSNLFGQSATLSGMSLALGNSGDRIVLKNNGSEIDRVAWENKDPGWNIYASNVSIARSVETDSDSVSDWAVQSSPGTPGTGVFAGCGDTGGGGGEEPGGGGGSDTALENGVAKTGLAAATSEQLNFTLDVPANAINLSISISGGSGDADLHTNFGSAATSSSYDCRPYLGGNNETCNISTAQVGTYHIMINAYSSFSSLSLTGSYSIDSGTGGGGGGTPPPGTDDPAGYSFNTYYSNASGQTGNNLKTALNGVIKNGHTKLSYTPGVWDALGFTDEDPNNSSNVLLIYKGTSINKATRAGQSSSQDAWNREHVWAKSHGFPSSGQWAYTDIHHLRPSDVSINSTRSNKDFDNGGTAISEAPSNFTDSDSFEPRDEVKGDVARMVFYMDVRYEGNDSSGTPDLEIADYVGTGSQALLGKLCTLVAWHRADAVSAWEVRRNGRIHQTQGNRNPFIDNPDWVESIYGSSCP